MRDSAVSPAIHYNKLLAVIHKSPFGDSAVHQLRRPLRRSRRAGRCEHRSPGLPVLSSPDPIFSAGRPVVALVVGLPLELHRVDSFVIFAPIPAWLGHPVHWHIRHRLCARDSARVAPFEPEITNDHLCVSRVRLQLYAFLGHPDDLVQDADLLDVLDVAPKGLGLDLVLLPERRLSLLQELWLPDGDEVIAVNHYHDVVDGMVEQARGNFTLYITCCFQCFPILCRPVHRCIPGPVHRDSEPSALALVSRLAVLIRQLNVHWPDRCGVEIRPRDIGVQQLRLPVGR